MVESNKKNKNAKLKKDVQKNNQNEASLGKRLEDFFYSDMPTATATKFLLMFVAVGAVVCGGAIVPGIIKLIGEFGMPDEKSKTYSPKQINNAFANLKRQKLVEIVKEKDGKMHVKLTNKGKKRILAFSIETVRIKKPKKWDKKWRVLMFDIPTEPKIYNQARNALRDKIKNLGFYQLQKSVWVYPYECEDELLVIAEIYHVQQYVEILTVEKLLHEDLLKQKFRL